MKFSVFAAAAALTLAGMGSASAQLIQNGDFEVAPIVGPNFLTVNAGETTIPFWTVGERSVDLINGNFGAITGTSVDVVGSPGAGSISQSFAAAVGTLYQLEFDLGANGSGFPLDVAFGGPANVAQYAAGVVGTDLVLTWLATSTSGLVKFSSTSTDYNGPVIDNVSVTAVPEPETYAMMLAGLGALGFMARRRKTKN